MADLVFVAGSGALAIGRLLDGEWQIPVAALSIVGGVAVVLSFAIGLHSEIRRRRALRMEGVSDAWTMQIQDELDALGRASGNREVLDPKPRRVTVTADPAGLKIWEGLFNPSLLGQLPWEWTESIELGATQIGKLARTSIRVQVSSPFYRSHLDLVPVGTGLFWVGAQGRSNVERIMDMWRGFQSRIDSSQATGTSSS